MRKNYAESICFSMSISSRYIFLANLIFLDKTVWAIYSDFVPQASAQTTSQRRTRRPKSRRPPRAKRHAKSPIEMGPVLNLTVILTPIRKLVNVGLRCKACPTS